jgi:hypothetical protein
MQAAEASAKRAAELDQIQQRLQAVVLAKDHAAAELRRELQVRRSPDLLPPRCHMHLPPAPSWGRGDLGCIFNVAGRGMCASGQWLSAV